MPTPLPTVLDGGIMTWTRLDDGWYEQPAFDELPHDVRWHYLALIQTCSRNQRYDGRVPGGVARRCSDVGDPDTAHAMLAALDLIGVGNDGAVTLLRIEDHIPPPHYRDEARKTRQREDTRRHRAHKAGNHELCLPGRCKSAPVSSAVSAYSGTETETGLDVTGEVPPPRRDADSLSAEGTSSSRAVPSQRPRPLPDNGWD